MDNDVFRVFNGRLIFPDTFRYNVNDVGLHVYLVGNVVLVQIRDYAIVFGVGDGYYVVVSAGSRAAFLRKFRGVFNGRRYVIPKCIGVVDS